MAERRFLKALGRRAWRWTLRGTVLVAAVLATIPLVFAFQARWRHPDLKPWHELAWIPMRPLGLTRKGASEPSGSWSA